MFLNTAAVATAAAAADPLMSHDANAQEEPGQRGPCVAVGAHAQVMSKRA